MASSIKRYVLFKFSFNSKLYYSIRDNQGGFSWPELLELNQLLYNYSYNESISDATM